MKEIKIIQPDDWHVHLREGEMLKQVTKCTSRVNKRCIAMPNTNIPITTFKCTLRHILFALFSHKLGFGFPS